MPWLACLRMSRRRTLAASLALLSLLLAWPLSAQRGAPSDAALAGRLADLVRTADLGDHVGVLVQRVESDQPLFSNHGDLALNPASNMKVLTAATALFELGPDFRMRTAVYGHIEDGRVANLVIRGQGDPTLRMSDLVDLAEDLADRGVHAVDHVVVDGSYFDDELLPPAFDQQPGEMASFRAAVGALAVDRASFVLRVLPGATVGAPAQVRLAGAGYFDVRGGVTTTESGAPRVIASQAPTNDHRLALTLSGSVPMGILGVGYRRRVEEPLAHAGYAMAEALARTGIRGRREVTLGGDVSGLPLLASHESGPLSEVLKQMGKHSDNFVAEMVLKVLGAEAHQPGTSAAGVQVIQRLLTRIGAPPGAEIINGSGLFDGNHIAPAHLVAILRAAYLDPSVRPEFVSQLSIAGLDGTLHSRLRDLPRPRIVRAKTGTLDDAIALSGYVLGPTPSETVCFSFVANGVRGHHGAARQLADDIARAIAGNLYQE